MEPADRHPAVPGVPTDRWGPESELPDSYNYLTIMEGPGVSGLGRIWFGYYAEPWTQLADDEDTGTIIQAEPVAHIPLPRPMTRPEIEEWADEEWCQKTLAHHLGEDGDSP